jgi:mannose-1-phosphate guanylyltransferase / mannose-6-phosphate isomerase
LQFLLACIQNLNFILDREDSMACDVVPIILCGGSGMRLWPLSTPDCPKPFHALFGKETLFQQALRRASGPPFAAPPIVVASARHQDLVLGQAADMGIVVEVILEQQAKDTCVAALVGALASRSRHGDCLLAILSADQAIPDTEGFQAMFSAAVPAAKLGFLVLFGMRPSGPHTNYGYIVPGAVPMPGGLQSVARFVEKPDAKVAQALISQEALWNSGNFLVSAEIILMEAQKFCAPAYHAASCALKDRHGESGIIKIGRYGENFEALSLDRAIVEHSKVLALSPCDLDWSDLGTWDEVRRASGSDGNYVRSVGPKVRVIGLEDIIVVATAEGILITRPGQSEALKAASK